MTDTLAKLAADIAAQNEALFPSSDDHEAAARSVISNVQTRINNHQDVLTADVPDRANPEKVVLDVKIKAGVGQPDVLLAHVLIESPKAAQCNILVGKPTNHAHFDYLNPLKGFKFDAATKTFIGAEEALIDRIDELAREWMNTRTR